MAVYTDFSSLLAGATLITGLIWMGDVLFFKSRRMRASTDSNVIAEPKLVEYARSFFPILLIVCLLRSFLVEPFRIPSGSMKPTLLEGDFILVNKYTYGIRLPVFGTKVVKLSSPQRGDILVFRSPTDTHIDYIKRVIGLPGDKISYKNKTVYVNGEPLNHEFLEVAYDTDGYGQTYPVKRYQEMLPGRPHSIYLTAKPETSKEEVTVPAGMYFVMGDNRDNSSDSRDWGFAPDDLILGKAILIWMSWDAIAKDIRWHRIFHMIND